jgi:ribosomal protein L25 (general stress protein Ctc)
MEFTVDLDTRAVVRLRVGHERRVQHKGEVRHPLNQGKCIWVVFSGTGDKIALSCLNEANYAKNSFHQWGNYKKYVG